MFEAEPCKKADLAQRQGVLGEGGGFVFVNAAVGIGEDILQVQEVVFAADEGVVGTGFQFAFPEGMRQD